VAKQVLVAERVSALTCACQESHDLVQENCAQVLARGAQVGEPQAAQQGSDSA